MALRHRLGWDPQFRRRSPWFWPLTAAGTRFESFRDWPSRDELGWAYAALAQLTDAEPLRFAENVRKQDRYAAGSVQPERLYDGRITCAGEVPTRERDWHDFFNALCFMTFPRSKRALHRRQYCVLKRRIEPGAHRLPAARTKEQDALTLFDEGGAVIAAQELAFQPLAAVSDAERPELLRQLVERKQAKVIPFGHALFEHLVEGLRCPGGSTRLVRVGDVSVPDLTLLAAVDRGLAALLDDPAVFLEPREGAHVRLAELGLA
jgi:Protein of unknown function (DUF3025)